MRSAQLTIVLVAGFCCLACLVSGTMPDGGGADAGSTAASCTPGGAPCEGCCAGATCKKGDLAIECGVQGAACVECASNTICRSDQGCSVDLESLWKVTPVAATIGANPAGGTWDPDGDPDVFVSLYCPLAQTSATAETAPVVDALMPRWSATVNGTCVLKAKDLMKEGFGAAVFDDDGRPPVEAVSAKAAVRVSQQHFDVGYLRASGGTALPEIWFKLEKQ